MITKPYFCRSQSGVDTDCFETQDEAVAAACEQKLAPFTIMQLLAHPIGHRLTNGDGAHLGRVHAVTE